MTRCVTCCRRGACPCGRYDDVNGDGVIDHVEAIGAQEGWAPLPTGAPFNARLPGCIVKVSSGSPPVEQLYNGSLCHSLRRASLSEELTRATVGFGRRSKALRHVEVATPVTVPVSRPRVRSTRQLTARCFVYSASLVPSVPCTRARSHLLHQLHGTPAWTCFFVSPGIVTCFDELGKRAWQTDAMDLGWKTDSNSPWAMVCTCPPRACAQGRCAARIGCLALVVRVSARRGRVARCQRGMWSPFTSRWPVTVS